MCDFASNKVAYVYLAAKKFLEEEVTVGFQYVSQIIENENPCFTPF